MLSAAIWPLRGAYAQEDAGSGSGATTAPATAEGSSATAEESPGLVEPSLEGSGEAETGADVPFTQGPSSTFNFASGFRGDCGSFNGAANLATGAAAPYQTMIAQDSGGSRYFQVSLFASETYTDNLNRQSSDQAVSDFITQIAPRFDACASTGRIRGNLSYTPEFVLYADNSEFNDIYNTVLGDATIELWPGRFYLDADTRYGQSVIDPSVSYSQSNTLAPRNQTATWASNISPYAVQSLGPLGTASLRYRFGKVLYGNNNVPDSTINAGYFNLTSPTGRGRLSWKLDAQTQQVKRSGGDARRFFLGFNDGDPNQPVIIEDDRADGRTTYFDQASLELGLQATRLVKLIAVGGLEDEYQEDGSNDRLSAAFYSAGVRLGTNRNTIEAQVGHHFYGTTFFVDAWHRGETFNASIRYDEQASSAGLNALNDNGRMGSIPGAGLGMPVTSQFDRGVFVEKRLTGQVGFDTARTSTGLTVYRRVRDYVISGVDNETYNGASLQTQYQLGPRSSVIPRFSWQNRESNGDAQFGGGYNTYQTGLTLTRALNPSSQAAVGYAHAWRDSGRRNSGYKENRVTLQYFKNF